jgi:hypothetical protein
MLGPVLSPPTGDRLLVTLDHGGDAVKGPVVGVEAVRAGALPQRLVNGVKLGLGRRGVYLVGSRLASACGPPAASGRASG